MSKINLNFKKPTGPKQMSRRKADLMDAYFSTNRNIALVVQLVDMRHKPSQLDLEMIDYLEQMGYEFVIALTKSDKLNKTQTKERLEALKNELSFLEKEPTMIVFFGDHQPNISDAFYEKLFGKPLTQLTQEEKEKMYTF